MTHAQLVDAAHKWILKETRCGVAFKEAKTLQPGEEPDVIGFGTYGLSIVVECKASRADFLADAKKPFRMAPETGMGQKRYYCCPEKLLTIEDMPRLWGLIYVNADGKAYCVNDPSEEPGSVKRLHERNIHKEISVMYSMLRKQGFKAATEFTGVAIDSTQPSYIEAGQVWVRKGSINQFWTVKDVDLGIVYIQSHKTGAIDKVPLQKFKRLYAISKSAVNE
jgi:hypothetical protein